MDPPIEEFDCITSHAQTTAASHLTRHGEIQRCSFCHKMQGGLVEIPEHLYHTHGLRNIDSASWVIHHDMLNSHYLALAATAEQLGHVRCCRPGKLGISGVSGPRRSEIISHKGHRHKQGGQTDQYP